MESRQVVLITDLQSRDREAENGFLDTVGNEGTGWIRDLVWTRWLLGSLPAAEGAQPLLCDDWRAVRGARRLCETRGQCGRTEALCGLRGGEGSVCETRGRCRPRGGSLRMSVLEAPWGPEGGVGGVGGSGGRYVKLPLGQVVAQQKPAQRCKAIAPVYIINWFFLGKKKNESLQRLISLGLKNIPAVIFWTI